MSRSRNYVIAAVLAAVLALANVITALGAAPAGLGPGELQRQPAALRRADDRGADRGRRTGRRLRRLPAAAVGRHHHARAHGRSTSSSRCPASRSARPRWTRSPRQSHWSSPSPWSGCSCVASHERSSRLTPTRHGLPRSRVVDRHAWAVGGASRQRHPRCLPGLDARAAAGSAGSSPSCSAQPPALATGATPTVVVVRRGASRSSRSRSVPVHRWVRRGVEDVVYTHHDDAFAVVTRLNRELEPRRDEGPSAA